MKFKKILSLITIFMLCLPYITESTVYADSEKYNVYTSDSEQNINDILTLKLDDLKDSENAYDWFNQRNEFSVGLSEKNTSGITYFWNAPNVQQAAMNQVYADNIKSGYAISRGSSTSEQNHFIKLPDQKSAKTAMQKYGFNIPNPVYLGEKPYITMSISDVLIPKSIPGTVAKIGKLLTNLSLINLEDFKNEASGSLQYANIADYQPNKSTFNNWVKHNWESSMSKIPSNQILSSKADKETGKIEESDAVFTSENILISSGLSSMHNDDYKIIVAKLQEITGNQFSDIATQIVKVSGGGTLQKYRRDMPYDIYSMSPASRAKFGGVMDPRASIQRNAYNTGYQNHLKAFAGVIISFSGKIAQFTVLINDFATFGYINSIGLTPEKIWDNQIVKFLTDLIIIGLLIFILRNFIQTLRGKRGTIKGTISTLTYVFTMFLLVALLADPKFTTKNVQKLSTNFWDVMNITFEKNDKTQPLYGKGASNKDKYNTTIWLPYFNVWTLYQTNHDILDKEQKINTKETSNEVKGLNVPQINSKQQDLWSTILAEELTTSGAIDNVIYRVPDHFMAPRLNPKLEKGKIISANAKQNEHYNGEIQTNINAGIILIQLLIFFMVCIKTILFYEFNINVVMLIIDVCLVSGNKKSVKLLLSRIPGSAFNVAIASSWSLMLIWASLTTSNLIGSFVVFLILSGITYFGLSKWVNMKGAFEVRSLSFLSKNIKKFNNRMEIGERQAEAAGNSRFNKQIKEESEE